MNKLNQIDTNKLILASIPGRIFMLDKKGKFSFWSKHSHEYYGYSLKEITGKKHFSFIFKNKISAKKILSIAMRRGSFDGEEALVKKSGKSFLNKVTLRKFYDNRKKFIGFIGINHDISNQEKLSIHLQNSLKKYKDLFDNAYDIIYFIDTKGRFIDMNRRAEEVIGASKRKYIGKSFRKIIHPDSLDLVLQRFKEGLAGKKVNPYHLQIITARGKTRTLEIKPSSITENGKITGRFATARDITEMIEIQQKLINSEKKYRGIFENANDVIFFVDKKGRLTDINRRAEKFLGKDKKQLLGKIFTRIIHPESRKTAKKAFMRGMKGEQIAPYLLKSTDKNGNIRTFEIKSSPLIENGIIVGRFGVSRDITDRIKAETEIERIKLQQDAILKNIPDIAWLKDRQSRFIAANEPMAKTLGLTPGNMVGKNDFDFYPRKLAEMYRSDDREVMRTRKRKRVEEPYIDVKGKQAWIETIKTPILGENGQVLGTTGIARDITERKAAKEALEKSWQKYKELADSLPQVIFETDNTGRLTFVNEFAFKLFGYSKAEFNRGLSIFEMLAPKEKEKAISRFKAIMSGEKQGSGEYSAVKRNGTVFPVIIHSSLIHQDGKYAGLRGMLVDISKMKRIEEALRESEKRYRVLFETSAEGILVADANTKRFKYANSAICNMLGYSESEIKSKHVTDIHPRADLGYVIKEFDAQARGEKNLAANIPCLRKNGSVVYTDVNATNVIIDGTPCVVGFFSDITQKKNLEEERLKLSRLAAIGTLSASIAHEIRNPLFSISTIAQSVKRECRTEKNEEILDAMIREISRLKDFIDDMLFYSKPQTVTKKRISPSKIIDEILFTHQELFSSKKVDLQMHNHLGPQDKIVADPSQIKRLFLNLLINAYEASPNGGTIKINQKISPSEEDQGYSISFHNAGKHIEKSDFESIFDLFHSTKPKGCGLGLPICKKIVEAHSGRIELKSSMERGTTFTVHF